LKLEDYEPLTETARRLGVTPSLVARWCREDKLPCYKANERAWLVKRGAEPDVAVRFRPASGDGGTTDG
jgi:hypothetical protein